MALGTIRTWSVTCPRCNTHNRSRPLKCGNCASNDVRLEAVLGTLNAQCRTCLQGVGLSASDCEQCGANLSALAVGNVANQAMLKVLFWTLAVPFGAFMLLVLLA